MKRLITWLGPLFFVQMSYAQLEYENLLQGLPPGYEIAYQARQGKIQITEMVPAGETVEDWTEMLTTQVFFGMTNVPTEQYRSQMFELWSAACANSESVEVRDGEENGYEYAVWLQLCPLNPQTGKPEVTFFKAIRGNDSLYLVQKAFRYQPGEDEIRRWTRYLAGIKVCDTRLADRQCPGE